MRNETWAACVGYTDVTLHANYISNSGQVNHVICGWTANARYVSKCRPLPAPLHFEPNCGGWMEIR